MRTASAPGCLAVAREVDADALEHGALRGQRHGLRLAADRHRQLALEAAAADVELHLLVVGAAGDGAGLVVIALFPGTGDLAACILQDRAKLDLGRRVGADDVELELGAAGAGVVALAGELLALAALEPGGALAAPGANERRKRAAGNG